MEINISRRILQKRPVASLLYDCIQNCSEQLGNAIVLFDFPIYKDFDGDAVYVQALIAAPEYGLLVFAIAESDREDEQLLKDLDQVISFIHSRLIRNRKLRAGRFQLVTQINYALFTSVVGKIIRDQDIKVIDSLHQLKTLLKGLMLKEPLDHDTFSELVSTLDGSKGLIRLKQRNNNIVRNSKGFFVRVLEDEIALFDNRQRYGFVVPTDGLQRIRGIAGTGKTVVLAMKAAVTHLKFPNETIIYTFYH